MLSLACEWKHEQMQMSYSCINAFNRYTISIISTIAAECQFKSVFFDVAGMTNFVDVCSCR